MSDNEQQNVFLGRQPILDRSAQLFAYELLFRNGTAQNGNFARFSDGNQATATVISNAFTEFSMADALGPYRGFIKVDCGLLCSDLINVLPQDSVVLEIVESVAPTPEVIARCAQLHNDGYMLALRVQPQTFDGALALLEYTDVVKVDISRQTDAALLTRFVERIKLLGKTTLAEKVESDEQMQFCRRLGFDLFQGYYFARPTVIEGKHLHPSEISLLRLLWLLTQDADDEAIETVFRKAPLLVVNLLRLINSAGSGMGTRVTSLRHAITLVGRRQLLRWLQLMLYSGPPGARQVVNPLLQLAATRGRLMELLVEKLPEAASGGRELVDQAYMVGILSLMPALFGGSMAEVLAQLPVVRPVHAALDEHGGTLGELLRLIEWLEDSQGNLADDPAPPRSPDSPVAAGTPGLLQRLPGIDARVANSCLSSALNWANNLARESF